MGFIFYNSSNNGELSDKRSHFILSTLKDSIKNMRKSSENLKQQTSKSKKSPENTSNNTEIDINTLTNMNNVSREEKFNIIVRKNAHAFEYFILAIIVSYSLFLFNIKGKNALIYIMFICLFYAVTDEFHQIFVPGRSSQVLDVIIDFAGSVIGMAVFYLVERTGGKWRGES